MTSEEEFHKQLMATFQAELEDHLITLSDGVLSLEKEADSAPHQALLEEMFRAAHSLKGAARAVALDDIATISHAMEDALGALRRGDIGPSSELADLFLAGLDTLRKAMESHLCHQPLPLSEYQPLLTQLDRAAKGEKIMARQFAAPDSGEPDNLPGDAPVTAHPPAREPRPQESPKPPLFSPSAPATEAPTPMPAAQKTVEKGGTIRVNTDKLDDLMEDIMELLVVRMRPSHYLEELGELNQRLCLWVNRWRQVRGQFQRGLGNHAGDHELRPLLDFFAASEDNLNAVREGVARLAGRVAKDSRQLIQVTDELQVNVLRLRMLPLSHLFRVFPRMIRDLARKSGKQIEFSISGADTEVDRQVLEAAKDPLTHLLRNAVDHGVEPPGERMESGKPRAGRVELRAFRRGSQVVLEVRDDGRGIDSDQIRDHAEQKGFLDGLEPREMDQQACIDILFRSGFSTKKQVTEFSGRGVGLDVVKSGVERINGHIHVESELKKMTSIKMVLPLTLAAVRAVLFRAAGTLLGLPADNVERIYKVRQQDLGMIEGKPAIDAEGRILPLLSLPEILKLPGNLDEGGDMVVMVVGMGGRRAAFQVESVLGTHDIVIKGLKDNLKKVPNVAGAAILGSGEVVVVLSAVDLLATARTGSAVSVKLSGDPAQPRQARLLVVDDSITTRTLEKNILETAGYRVLVASDGEEAWSMLQGNEFDLVVSDVTMPGLDGFGLAKRIKGDGRYKGIPVVLVTYLDSEEDKIKGLESGANAYITKTQFDQGYLLETIEKLLD